MDTLVLGLGNDLIADDALGLAVVAELQPRLSGQADVVGSSLHGLALLELFLGYRRAIVIDGIVTGTHPPGTIIELTQDQLRPVAVPSPHFAGFPEMLLLAQSLGLGFPRELRLFAVELADAATIGGTMSDSVRRAIPELCDRVCAAVAAPFADGDSPA